MHKIILEKFKAENLMRKLDALFQMDSTQSEPPATVKQESRYVVLYLFHTGITLDVYSAIYCNI